MLEKSMIFFNKQFLKKCSAKWILKDSNDNQPSSTLNFLHVDIFCVWLSGDTDGRVPVLSTRYSLSSLGLPIKRAWRPWYHNKQVPF